MSSLYCWSARQLLLPAYVSLVRAPVSVLFASTSQNLLCTITCGRGAAARRKNRCTGIPALTRPERMSPSALVTITSMSQPSASSCTSLRMITARSVRKARLAIRISPLPEAEPPSEQSISSMPVDDRVVGVAVRLRPGRREHRVAAVVAGA